ncbi:hypothetical protein BH24ACT13_BH24ACT13_01150 [soil metagenome]|jgi:hypothetical protein
MKAVISTLAFVIVTAVLWPASCVSSSQGARCAPFWGTPLLPSPMGELLALMLGLAAGVFVAAFTVRRH